MPTTSNLKLDPLLLERVAAFLDDVVQVNREGGHSYMANRKRQREEAQLLPGETLVPAILKAAKGVRRRLAAAHVMLWRPDLPESRAEIEALLKRGEEQLRSDIVQTIGLEELTEWAPLLNEVMETDPDSFIRGRAIASAGRLKQHCNLPTLLRMAETRARDYEWEILWAFTRFGDEACRPFLEARFANEHVSPPIRVPAAWGLATLGDPRAVKYLVEMLDLGQGNDKWRAAQALADVFGYPFEWGADGVAPVKGMALNDPKVRACL